MAEPRYSIPELCRRCYGSEWAMRSELYRWAREGWLVPVSANNKNKFYTEAGLREAEKKSMESRQIKNIPKHDLIDHDEMKWSRRKSN